MRNLQEQVKKAFCYQKLFWRFTVWINCSDDLKNFANSQPSPSNFKSFSQSLEQFFLTVDQNNCGTKIPLLIKYWGWQNKLCLSNKQTKQFWSSRWQSYSHLIDFHYFWTMKKEGLLACKWWMNTVCAQL